MLSSSQATLSDLNVHLNLLLSFKLTKWTKLRCVSECPLVLQVEIALFQWCMQATQSMFLKQTRLSPFLIPIRQLSFFEILSTSYLYPPLPDTIIWCYCLHIELDRFVKAHHRAFQPLPEQNKFRFSTKRWTFSPSGLLHYSIISWLMFFLSTTSLTSHPSFILKSNNVTSPKALQS